MKNAKIIIKQLLKAVIHLQEANIFHRDIKAENILIETGSKVPKIYLIDFGVSCFDDLKNYKHFHGTWVHVPPEFDRQGFHSSGPTNVWQVGLVLYYILHKKQFFTRGFLSKRLKINTRLSEKCKDFLTKCLTVDPEKRPTLEELLHHRWVDFSKNVSNFFLMQILLSFLFCKTYNRYVMPHRPLQAYFTVSQLRKADHVLSY
uniref:non-specific serine/threonine protein kinase n=1 Tax=Cyprinodon variegatus TaxID=28743 RepID=A0A3Q2DW92_CYPVA